MFLEFEHNNEKESINLKLIKRMKKGPANDTVSISWDGNEWLVYKGIDYDKLKKTVARFQIAGV